MNIFCATIGGVNLVDKAYDNERVRIKRRCWCFTTGRRVFCKTSVKKGAVGWLLLVGLGVSYVISGDFAGWNFGLAQGGWGDSLLQQSSSRLCIFA